VSNVDKCHPATVLRDEPRPPPATSHEQPLAEAAHPAPPRAHSVHSTSPARSKRSARTRPSSSPSASGAGRVRQRQRAMPVAQWRAAEVGQWIEDIGMGQYKKHFVHNAVGGPLLLSLDLESMRTELKISPLGHRAAILEAIQGLGDTSRGPSLRQGASALC
jgi:SAM domain (Sterile alpha motif)